MTDGKNRLEGGAQDADERLIAGIRRELDRSCDALDGHTLSRLNRIRHVALARRQSRATRLLLPFGGFVTACVLVLTVTLFMPGSLTESDDPVPPLEDIDILASNDSLDLYEDYEFYEWLASNE
ncbi:MAG TPA: hypothetical protein VGE69_17500 [Pseudomonadales bacterium]